ncbi:uncharacterized protein LOC129718477 [Wyeomyia smithii]|uniref:uncharacterized protein LOC129718477 n=1 Tax=Wyeomyia smithii TaxID=174621 RepID=UPI002468074A|nr:uncharacterized protein LOC129718477 [Wyeomyia smithii]
MTLEEVVKAIRANQRLMAERLLKEEWLAASDPTELFYRLIKNGMVEVLKLLQEMKLYSEWEVFRYGSNVVNELNVKNVEIPSEMEVYLLYILSTYGFRNLRGDPASEKPANYWEDSISKVEEYYRKLRQRKKWYDYLDVDDEVIFQLRIIHNHLYFIKDHELIKPLPLREMIFCLAFFLQVCRREPNCDIYATIINKRKVMQYLRALVSRLVAIKVKANNKPKQNHMFKRLRKTYRKAKPIHSIFKVLQSGKLSEELVLQNRANVATAIASMKRFSQILGEATSNIAHSPNFSARFSELLPYEHTSSQNTDRKYRNESTHGFPLLQLWAREVDYFHLFDHMLGYLRTVSISFLYIWIYILDNCILQFHGTMRRCRTVEEMQAFVRYAGSSQILSLHQRASQDVVKHLGELRQILNETGSKIIASLYEKEIERIKSMQQEPICFSFVPVQIAAFGDAPIEAIYRLLNLKLNIQYNDQMSWDWKQLIKLVTIRPVLHKIAKPFLIPRNFYEPEMKRYREKSHSILNRFASNLRLDDELLGRLEEKLHNALSKRYYQHIFALDCKAQAIRDSLKLTLVGTKASLELRNPVSKQQTREFKQRNQEFKNNLEVMLKNDKQELKEVFLGVIRNIRDAFDESRCDTVENFTKNIHKIPLKTKLAIEYWQLQALEILEASGYFGDNFILLTTSVPIIWGKSYRNYLAHDSISYDLLTGSSSLKTLVNGFVLARHSDELDIFAKSSKFDLSDLSEVERDACHWLTGQKNLLDATLERNHSLFAECLQERADFHGRYLRSLGFCEQLNFYFIPDIAAHAGFNVDEFKTDLVQLEKDNSQEIDNLFSYNKLTTELNMRRFDKSFPVRKAISEFKMRQPQLVTPCIGALLPHLQETGQNDLMVELLQEYAEKATKMLLLICAERTHSTGNFMEKWTFIPIHPSSSALDQLFSAGKSVSKEVLTNVITVNDNQIFEYIMRKCYNTDRSTLLESDSSIVLITSCMFGRLKMVRTLLDLKPGLDISVLNTALNASRVRIAQLLIGCGANPWSNEMSPVRSGITERNFKFIRKVLNESFPEHFHKEVACLSAQFGSERFIRFVLTTGIDIWQCGGVLEAALKNKRTEIFDLLRELIFKPVERFCESVALHTWMRLVNDLKILAYLLTDPYFIVSCVSKNLHYTSEILDQIFRLLTLYENSHAVNCLVADSAGSVEIDLQNLLSNQELAATIIQKCSSIQKFFVDCSLNLLQDKRNFTSTKTLPLLLGISAAHI